VQDQLVSMASIKSMQNHPKGIILQLKEILSDKKDPDFVNIAKGAFRFVASFFNARFRLD
jgi:hypothetical protein